jgi:hypothetical protein
MNVRRNDLLPLLLACTGVAAWIWSAQHDPFFWDTVQLASKHAHFFLKNGLHWSTLPPEIDSGHPPVFGFYLACVWSWFGKTLPASHWAMFPFLMGIVWFLYRLGQRLAGPERAFWLLPLVLLDPVAAAQSILVGPDIVLLCFFLMATEGVLGRKNLLTSLGILGLCAIGMRGMMTAAALFVFCTVDPLSTKSGAGTARAEWRSMMAERGSILFLFLPGFAFAAFFLLHHHREAGWTGFHPGSPWSPAFERVTGAGFLKNIAVLGWRWLDFGRIFEWLLAGGLLYRFLQKKGKPPARRLLLLCLVLLVFLSPSALLYQNLSAHRYFLPCFAAFHLLIFQWFFGRPDFSGFSTPENLRRPENPKNPGRPFIFGTLLLLLALGNFWIYPRDTSMGWDSTLAHLPYHRLRADALEWLDRRNIDLQSVGTAFPNINTGENLLLNGDQRSMRAIDFSQNNFIFASNVFNDVSEADYAVLERDWKQVWRKKHAGVWVEIYARKPR